MNETRQEGCRKYVCRMTCLSILTEKNIWTPMITVRRNICCTISSCVGDDNDKIIMMVVTSIGRFVDVVTTYMLYKN